MFLVNRGAISPLAWQAGRQLSVRSAMRGPMDRPEQQISTHQENADHPQAGHRQNRFACERSLGPFSDERADQNRWSKRQKKELRFIALGSPQTMKAIANCLAMKLIAKGVFLALRPSAEDMSNSHGQSALMVGAMAGHP
ncbi:hypothetical protein OMP43_16320 [Sphingomonas sp. CBMAI 2297]|uniref:hypothetical protein n=1 Tax=Sphingomonas sp. CBMAI 2297 TaxID=2991720 RepID=UPI0024563DF8|nr:hypothetical protein [Sphingomonas sp. CBMAI 2297]MDH4745590.1 hypothetical protein [Sphingomonas sp. CBMAI 2297]